MLILPFTSDSSQEFIVNLDGEKFTLAAKYNERSASWTFDLTRESDQLLVLQGVPLLLGQDLLEPYALGLGGFVPTDLSQNDQDAGPDDFGDRLVVTWFSPTEMLIVGGNFTPQNLPVIAAAIQRAGGAVTIVVNNITNTVQNTGNIVSNTTTVNNLLVPFSDNNEHADDSGTEVVIAQFAVDLTPNPAGSVTFDVSFYASSAAGTATYRAYLGGTRDTVDGTLIGSVTQNVSPFGVKRIRAAVTNPAAAVPLKITIQSSANGIDARIDDLTGSIG